MSKGNVYWKHDVERLEALKIILHGNAEFEAVDVVLQVSIAQQHLLNMKFPSLRYVILVY